MMRTNIGPVTQRAFLDPWVEYIVWNAPCTAVDLCSSPEPSHAP
jgi:hypothetical protein